LIVAGRNNVDKARIYLKLPNRDMFL